MAAESNAASGFHSSEGLIGNSLNSSSSLVGRPISFQSEMIPLGLSGSYFGGNFVNSGGSCLNVIGGNSPRIIQGGPVLGVCSSSGSLFPDSVPVLKHNAGLAVEWSPEEQYKLEEGLVKFADEPSIMRYIKIAAALRDKTVRDVALRCRWMTRKRRKPEEQMAGKKVNDQKDKLVDSFSKTTLASATPMNISTYTSMTQQIGQKERMPFEGISATVKHLLEQNAQALSQISVNLSTLKLRDNVNLFSRARNNITTILNDMSDTPGIMSQMPPLTVSINEDLANTILSNTTQGFF